MPRPRADESERDYISRFMASEEARRDYPDEKQRAAVAYSLWEHRNMLANAGAEWPKLYSGRHLEPGLVRYADVTRPDGGSGATFLLPKETIDQMRPTMRGKPIVNEDHATVDPGWFKKGKADGVTVDGLFKDDGWEWVNFLVWDESTKRNCERGYQLSCAYVPTKIDWTSGVHHAVPYDGVIREGRYTHVAVVPVPRYEGARIFANTLGGNAMKLLAKIFGKDESVDLKPDTPIELDGKNVPLLELVNAHKAVEAEKAKVKALENGTLNDDSMIDVDGIQMPLKSLKDSYRTRRNAEEEAEKKRKEKEEEERKNAEKCEECGEKPCVCEKGNAEKAEEEKRKKEAEEKERKNAADKAAKEKERQAGKKHFEALQNAAREAQTKVRTGRALVSLEDKVARGASTYGSAKPQE